MTSPPTPPLPGWLARQLEQWYRSNARDLPWRSLCDDVDTRGYRALVSEAMLQQTQVSRVIEAYERFMRTFPTVRDLAAAEEDLVLRHWQGLGYYRRARNLLAAARMIVNEFQGVVPESVDELKRLPGVGPYTAGAISSIAFDRPAAIVDGNVIRVIARLHGISEPVELISTQKTIWAAAEAAVSEADSPAEFNQGLMELGATVCLPKQPRCETACPLRDRCTAFRTGAVGSIPAPKRRVEPQPLYAYVLIVRRRNEILITRRPADAPGLWAAMWEPITLESTHPLPLSTADVVVEDRNGAATVEIDIVRHVEAAETTAEQTVRSPNPRPRTEDHSAAIEDSSASDSSIVQTLIDRLQSRFGLRPVSPAAFILYGGFVHQTTHRSVHFRVYELVKKERRNRGSIGRGSLKGRASPVRGRTRSGTWVAIDQLHTMPMSNAQRRVLKTAGIETPGPKADATS
ncbi:MAG: hypothetical protein ACOC0P_03090 [Planctomycetota bacterium]